jgi:hypothetical protein
VIELVSIDKESVGRIRKAFLSLQAIDCGLGVCFCALSADEKFIFVEGVWLAQVPEQENRIHVKSPSLLDIAIRHQIEISHGSIGFAKNIGLQHHNLFC